MSKVVQQNQAKSPHESRATVAAKRTLARTQRHGWKQRARAIILELADGDFGRAQAQYEGYTT